jgi:guanylate kinase
MSDEPQRAKGKGPKAQDPVSHALCYLPRRRGILFVLSGPSGVGKDALLTRLLASEPPMPEMAGVRKCVTATTRAPRPGEVAGVDYHYWDVATFQEQVAQGALLEWAAVFGNYYGTPRAWVEERRAAGEDVILKIDVQGGLAVKERHPDAVMIFLLPPSLEELERRLQGRLTDSAAQIATRRRDARFELSQARLYDYLVVNDRLEVAVARVASIIIAERCRTAHQAPQWAELWEEIEHGQTPV